MRSPLKCNFAAFLFLATLLGFRAPALGKTSKDLCQIKFSDTQTLGQSYQYFLKSDIFVPKAELFEKTFTLPPPPSNCSSQKKRELEKAATLTRERTKKEADLSLQETRLVNIKIGPYSLYDLFVEDFVFNEFDPDFRLYYGLINSIIYRQKIKFDVVRPAFLNEKISTVIRNPPSPAYPSGRSTQVYLYAQFLSDLEPELKKTFEADADAIAHRRVLAGVNTESDVTSAHELASAIYGFLKKDPQFQKFFSRYKDYFQKNIKKKSSK